MKSDKKAENAAANVNTAQHPADAAPNGTPASPAPSATGVRVEHDVPTQDDVPTKAPAGHNTPA